MAQFVRTAREVRQFPLPEGTPAPQLLEHLNLLNEGRPTNAAILLFGKSPQRFLISSEIRCAHFHGTEVAKPIPSYQVYKGTAFALVDQAVDFVLSKINRRIGTRAESARASRTYEIPVEVVTEAVVNAVVHRDYTDNGSVQVMLFSDRLEVRNPGRLPPLLTLENLREAHRSVPGNPLLGEALYLTAYIERMGTGTLDMIRRCVETGLPEPEFAVADGFVTTIRRVVIPRRESKQPMGAAVAATSRGTVGYGVPVQAQGQAGGHAGHAEDQVRGHAGGQEGQVGGQAEGQVGGQEGQAALSAKELAMLRACLSGAAPAETLSAIVGHSSRTGHFKRWLKSLLAGGFLEMTVPDRPTSPAQRYRLTDKGRAAIAPDGDGQAKGEAADEGGGQVGGQAEGQDEGQAEGQAGGQEGQAALSTKAIAMLQVCLDEPVVAEALMAAAGHASRTGQFRRCLHRLLRDGLLELTVPGKPRSPAQKYRLTERGRAFLRSAREGHQDEGV